MLSIPGWVAANPDVAFALGVRFGDLGDGRSNILKNEEPLVNPPRPPPPPDPPGAVVTESQSPSTVAADQDAAAATASNALQSVGGIADGGAIETAVTLVSVPVKMVGGVILMQGAIFLEGAAIVAGFLAGGPLGAVVGAGAAAPLTVNMFNVGYNMFGSGLNEASMFMNGVPWEMPFNIFEFLGY